MDNYFKGKEFNPISEVLGDLTTNQKMSVISFLIAIAVCDQKEGWNDKEIDFVYFYINTFGFDVEKCFEYYNSAEGIRMFSDLKSLSPEQLEFLVIATIDMINCDGGANETEIKSMFYFFKKIGADEEKVTNITDKFVALKKHFSGK